MSVDGSGAVDLQLVLFQLFFTAAGLAAGIRLADDVKRWKQARIRSGEPSDG